MASHWRDEFLLAIEGHVPQAVKELRTRVLPAYEDLSEKVFGVQGLEWMCGPESWYNPPDDEDRHFARAWGLQRNAAILTRDLRHRLDGRSRASLVGASSGPGRNAAFWSGHRSGIELFIDAFEDWCSEYGMSEPWFADYALQTLIFWRDNRVEDEGWPTLEWIDPVDRPEFPQWYPEAEIRSDFVERVSEMVRAYCHDVEDAMGRQQAKRADRGGKRAPDRKRHMRRFVKVQVGGCRPSEITQQDGITVDAVRRANKRTAERVGISDDHRRRLSPGPPRRP